MPLYKNVKASYYDESLKAIVKTPKDKLILKDGIVGELINIETNVFNKVEKVIKLIPIEKSNYRVKPICKIFNKCGGCALQHISYLEQLNIKTKKVQELFDNTLKLNIKVKPTIGMKDPYHYRNKSQVVFKFNKGKMISGFYEEGTHDVIDYDECHLQDESANNIIKTIKELMIKMRISAYDEDRRTGIIRHVLIKTSFTTKESLVVLVVGTENFPGRNNFIKALTSKCKNISTIIQNINNRKTSVVLGDKETVLYGKGFIYDNLLGYKFKITSKSFYQINHEQTEKLYSEAVNLANINSNEVVLDAYCGVGTIGIIAANKAKKVIGVELVKDAVENAIVNAKNNNIKNISFFCQDATNFMVNMARRKEKLDVLIMDPPRSGSTKEFLEATLLLDPKKIVYVSCNPYTQVEDLKVLLKNYEIKQIQPVDMFPHTGHVESVVCLTRK